MITSNLNVGDTIVTDTAYHGIAKDRTWEILVVGNGCYWAKCLDDVRKTLGGDKDIYTQLFVN